MTIHKYILALSYCLASNNVWARYMERLRYNTHPPWQSSIKTRGPSLWLRTREKRLGELPTTMRWIVGKEYTRRLADFVSGQLRFHTHIWYPDILDKTVMNNFGEIHFIIDRGIIVEVRDVPYDITFGRSIDAELN